MPLLWGLANLATETEDMEGSLAWPVWQLWLPWEETWACLQHPSLRVQVSRSHQT